MQNFKGAELSHEEGHLKHTDAVPDEAVWGL